MQRFILGWETRLWWSFLAYARTLDAAHPRGVGTDINWNWHSHNTLMSRYSRNYNYSSYIGEQYLRFIEGKAVWLSRPIKKSLYCLTSKSDYRYPDWLYLKERKHYQTYLFRIVVRSWRSKRKQEWNRRKSILGYSDFFMLMELRKVIRPLWFRTCDICRWR